MLCLPTEDLKGQLDQGEEKTSKMKQLLVKTKKDLADAKKQVCSVLVRSSHRLFCPCVQQLAEESTVFCNHVQC